MLQLQNFTIVFLFVCLFLDVMGKILREPQGQIPVFTQLVGRAVIWNLIL